MLATQAISDYERNDKSSFVGKLARKTDHSTARGDISLKSTHSAPEKGKNGNNLTYVREQVARRVQHSHGILTENRRTLEADVWSSSGR